MGHDVDFVACYAACRVKCALQEKWELIIIKLENNA